MPTYILVFCAQSLMLECSKLDKGNTNIDTNYTQSGNKYKSFSNE